MNNNENQPMDFRAELHEKSRVKKVIGVVSGKGGVGKSLVTSLLAILMNRKGYRTAILDADVTGPSIPTAFGVQGKAGIGEYGILPVETKTGIQMISINFFLENETDPVVWRGPIVSNTVKQFWSDVIWEDIDYMFVDMPPGTGDVPLTVFQSLAIDGLIIVTSPQELVSMIVAKAVNMAGMMNVPIIGMVENMAYFTCPDCAQRHHIFGPGHLKEIAAKEGIETISQIPIMTETAALVDQGEIESFQGDYLDKIIEALERLEERK